MGTESPELLVEEYQFAKELVANATEAGTQAGTSAEQSLARSPPIPSSTFSLHTAASELVIDLILV